MMIFPLMILFLVYVSTATAVTFVLVKLAKRFDAKRNVKIFIAALSVATFVLIPTWDIPIARQQYEHLCQTEAGVKIYKSVDGVEGFINVFSGIGVAEDILKNYGYQFVEGTDVSNKWIRYSLDEHGKAVKQHIDVPTARYRIDKVQSRLEYAVKDEIVIDDVRTKEKLATKTAFSPQGGWLAQELHWFVGSCRGNDMELKEFFTKTLRPINRTH
jgi:hypothetical protein